MAAKRSVAVLIAIGGDAGGNMEWNSARGCSARARRGVETVGHTSKSSFPLGDPASSLLSHEGMIRLLAQWDVAERGGKRSRDELGRVRLLSSSLIPPRHTSTQRHSGAHTRHPLTQPIDSRHEELPTTSSTMSSILVTIPLRILSFVYSTAPWWWWVLVTVAVVLYLRSGSDSTTKRETKSKIV